MGMKLSSLLMGSWPSIARRMEIKIAARTPKGPRVAPRILIQFDVPFVQEAGYRGALFGADRRQFFPRQPFICHVRTPMKRGVVRCRSSGARQGAV
jgi:hypothetical protein